MRCSGIQHHQGAELFTFAFSVLGFEVTVSFDLFLGIAMPVRNVTMPWFMPW
jgi:hypothetical protein